MMYLVSRSSYYAFWTVRPSFFHTVHKFIDKIKKLTRTHIYQVCLRHVVVALVAKPRSLEKLYCSNSFGVWRSFLKGMSKTSQNYSLISLPLNV